MGYFINFILDIVFPRHCLGCDILLGDEDPSYVCRHCWTTINVKNNFACAFCQAPVKNGKTCPFCIKAHDLDRLLVATSYDNRLVERIVKTMKYGFVKSLADGVANLMAAYFKKRLAAGLEFSSESSIVAAVPLHIRRLNWRGFNQAEIIGESIGKNLGLFFAPDMLRRIRNNKPQAEIPDQKSRIENVQNIFKLNRDRKERISVKAQTVLLIDDVSTTGSTLDGCANALKNAGAKEVWGLVFARGKI